MSSSHRLARAWVASALLLAACGGPNALAQRDAEAQEVATAATKRFRLFMAFAGVGPAGPTESHLVSWHGMKEGEIKAYYEDTRPLRFSGLTRASLRATLDESAMHAELARRTHGHLAALGGEAGNRDAAHAVDRSVWQAIRAAREVLGFAEVAPSAATLPEVGEAQATLARLEADWPAVKYDPALGQPPRR